MKKFIKAVFCFGALMLALTLAGLFALPNATLRASMVGALPGKLERAKALASPKVLLVGGSNVSFGMDGAEVSRALGQPVYNMGVYGSFGLKAMLDQASRVARPGDTLAVFPEYEQLTSRRNFLGVGEGHVAMLCEVDRHGFLDLSAEQWLALAGDFLGYAHTKWTKPKVWWNRKALPWYSADAFNKHGDVAAHRGVARKGFETPPPWQEAALDTRTAADLRAFAGAMAARGIRVVFMPPACAACVFDANAVWIEGIAAAMRENNTPFAAPCERYRFDDELFFDSTYHLSFDAGPARATRVAEDLGR